MITARSQSSCPFAKQNGGGLALYAPRGPALDSVSVGRALCAGGSCSGFCAGFAQTSRAWPVRRYA